jgi:beta-glucosidase
VPLYVTENGAAFYDPPCARDGRINDPLRVDYYRDHLRAIHDAIESGVDLRGYFAWSLMDNLEWSLGYSMRFGLVHVNFETQERVPKDSAHFYAGVIASRGAALGAEGEERCNFVQTSLRGAITPCTRRGFAFTITSERTP